MSLKFIKPERILLATHPEYREQWVQERIAQDPSILGLGRLVLKDKERIQPRGGRLDLLFQDEDSTARYEVEVMLGSTDETHIIRTIEYWDVERKRFPQYDHYAVIVAEDITSRFLNVIGLFNGCVPLIALQMSALKFGDQITLFFTKVVDVVSLGNADDGQETQAATDRNYWETERSTRAAVTLADEILKLIKAFAPDLELTYKKFYIGIAKDGQSNLFVTFRPNKSAFKIDFYLKQSQEIDRELEEAGIDVIDYNKRWGAYRLRLTREDIQGHSDLLIRLLKMAYGMEVDAPLVLQSKT